MRYGRVWGTEVELGAVFLVLGNGANVPWSSNGAGARAQTSKPWNEEIAQALAELPLPNLKPLMPTRAVPARLPCRQPSFSSWHFHD